MVFGIIHFDFSNSFSCSRALCYVCPLSPSTYLV